MIAHRHPAYAPFRTVWEDVWRHRDARRDGVVAYRRYYLYNDPTQSATVRASADGAELTFAHAETYPAPGLLLKTLGAIDHLDREGVAYDYLLRTNLSSLFDWSALTDRLAAWGRRRRFVAGAAYKPWYMSGMCLLLSRDLVHELATHRDRLYQVSRSEPEAWVGRRVAGRRGDRRVFPVPGAAARVRRYSRGSFFLTRAEAEPRPFNLAHRVRRRRGRGGPDRTQGCRRPCGTLAAGPATVHYRFHGGYGLSDDRTLDHHNMRRIGAWLVRRTAQEAGGNGEPAQSGRGLATIVLAAVIGALAAWWWLLRRRGGPTI